MLLFLVAPFFYIFFVYMLLLFLHRPFLICFLVYMLLFCTFCYSIFVFAYMLLFVCTGPFFVSLAYMHCLFAQCFVVFSLCRRMFIFHLLFVFSIFDAFWFGDMVGVAAGINEFSHMVQLPDYFLEKIAYVGCFLQVLEEKDVQHAATLKSPCKELPANLHNLPS